MADQDVEWIRNPLSTNLVGATAKTMGLVDAVLEYEEGPAQNYMRQNATWTDQTGNARQGLFAQHFVGSGPEGEHGLTMYHTVPYGLYLETRFSGRFKIIMPAVMHTGRRIMRELRGLLRQL